MEYEILCVSDELWGACNGSNSHQWHTQCSFPRSYIHYTLCHLFVWDLLKKSIPWMSTDKYCAGAFSSHLFFFHESVFTLQKSEKEQTTNIAPIAPPSIFYCTDISIKVEFWHWLSPFRRRSWTLVVFLEIQHHHPPQHFIGESKKMTQSLSSQVVFVIDATPSLRHIYPALYESYVRRIILYVLFECLVLNVVHYFANMTIVFTYFIFSSSSSLVR